MSIPMDLLHTPTPSLPDNSVTAFLASEYKKLARVAQEAGVNLPNACKENQPLLSVKLTDPGDPGRKK